MSAQASARLGQASGVGAEVTTTRARGLATFGPGPRRGRYGAAMDNQVSIITVVCPGCAQVGYQETVQTYTEERGWGAPTINAAWCHTEGCEHYQAPPSQ